MSAEIQRVAQGPQGAHTAAVRERDIASARLLIGEHNLRGLTLLEGRSRTGVDALSVAEELRSSTIVNFNQFRISARG